MIKMESFAYNGLCPNRAMNFNANFTHYTKLMAGNALMPLMRFTVCGRAALSKGEHAFIDSLSGLTVSNSLQGITIVISFR